MRDDYKEQLSALVDDELRPEESRFLTARIGEDAEACRQIGDYVTIRHALQGSLTDANRHDPRCLAKRVAVALSDEPAHELGRQRSVWRRWGQPIAGVALAASVAAVTLAVWPTGDLGPPQPTTASLGDGRSAPSLGATPQRLADSSDIGAGVRTVSTGDTKAATAERLDPVMRERLNRYMINHSEHAAGGAVGRVMTYVRIAGQDVNE